MIAPLTLSLTYLTRYQAEVSTPESRGFMVSMHVCDMSSVRLALTNALQTRVSCLLLDIRFQHGLVSVYHLSLPADRLRHFLGDFLSPSRWCQHLPCSLDLHGCLIVLGGS